MITTKDAILTPRGAFSLAQSIHFLHRFEPLSYGGDGDDAGQPLRLAFAVERDSRFAAGSDSCFAPGREWARPDPPPRPREERVSR
ncbi:MAG: hypothetical protein AVDCRST_MAG67-1426 [uncultured Solirubrobacteraceae bacterium]|uniref:Uncharacterized protein n=1 Tax=uncultured Solirubrobacteraceae bacterium TaxID=1162706 RepID=A0A6J4S7L9_9ACTN|nr:MAG: hypothetical protein AVDCRST_MAG67-1426 [uncultured Solirubrobacteraceae bacterium]